MIFALNAAFLVAPLAILWNAAALDEQVAPLRIRRARRILTVQTWFGGTLTLILLLGAILPHLSIEALPFVAGPLILLAPGIAFLWKERSPAAQLRT